LKPIVKTKTYDENGEVHARMRTVPWSPADLDKLQEKYSRRPDETETEYVWRVSLTGGDRILLSEDEAEGIWGFCVFLNTTPGNHVYSLTARAAYWAGGINPQERGDPLIITTKGLSDLASSVQKAACVQAIYNRKLGTRSPMSAPIDPERLTPLIRGLPASLQLYLLAMQDRLQADVARNAGLPRWQQPAPIPSWTDLLRDLISYGRRVGWVSTTLEKP
ncbi:hypothetical protein N340_03542, partial [Tauraco erythrolophus]